ncbi:MAG: ankyrin repeat domain-containing protein [bacterium]|nr:ankyrin repeat domain-containing protein [bacterium]
MLKDCKECEWNEEYTLVFLKSKSDSISSKYKKLLPKKKEYKIEDINESSKLCGFLPMSSSEFHQAVYYGELEKVRELSKNNKSLINAKDENGYQPLHIATVEGYPEIVRFLISCGADINGKTKSDEWAPLHLAVRFYKINIVKLLLKKS